MKNLLLAALAALVVFGNTGCSKDPDTEPEPDPEPAQSAIITKVQLLSFPAYQPNGDDWDTFSSWPDIYFNFEPGTTLNGDYYTSTYYDECAAGTVVTWNNLSIAMYNLATPWAFGIYDYDTPTDSYMTGFYFNVTTAQRTDRPPYLEHMNNAGLTVRLYVTWFD